ncbi:MAG: TRAP transporter small permease subunit [Alphaproteobacteria bacterium]
MQFIAFLSKTIDWASGHFGRAVSWLALLMVLVVMANVVMRYVFGITDPKLQELPVYLHGMLFMLAAAYTLREQGHVRVDIFYRAASAKRKAVTDLFGHLLFVLPFMTLVLVESWDYVAAAWKVTEGSTATSGIHLVYILKTVIPVFAVTVAIQSISEAIKAVLILLGLAEPPEEDEAAHGTL